MNTAIEPAVGDDAPERASLRDHLTELRSNAARLARRSGDDTERWLLLAGAVLVPVGLLAIVAGYWGAAHTGRVIQQIPYQISGGMLGTALVFAGGFSYFAYWLTRVLREQQRVSARLDAQTAALVEELRALRSAVAGTEAASTELVSTRRGALVHRPTCSVVAGRADVRPATLDNGHRPCKVCLPG